MADISKINPNGTTYNIKDASARSRLTTAEAALSEVVDKGAKNVIIFDGVGTGTSNVGTSYTSNGITFQVQSDGTIRATGTIASGNSYCYLYAGTDRINIIDAFDGKHVLSGNPQGASLGTYRLWYKVGSQTAVSVVDSSVILPEVAGETRAVLGVQVDAPQTNLDITFKPMICTKAAWDASHTYVPYVPTNKELYESKVDKARPSISSNSNLNDYKQVGHFKVTSSSVASSITNTPFTVSGYILDVDYWYQVLSDATGCIQTAMANVANTLTEKKRIYQYQNGAWSWTPWVTIYSISIPT